MRVSYNKLWKLLIDKKMKKIELRDKTQISSSTLALIGKDHSVTSSKAASISCSANPIRPEDSIKKLEKQKSTLLLQGTN